MIRISVLSTPILDAVDATCIVCLRLRDEWMRKNAINRRSLIDAFEQDDTANEPRRDQTSQINAAKSMLYLPDQPVLGWREALVDRGSILMKDAPKRDVQGIGPRAAASIDRLIGGRLQWRLDGVADPELVPSRPVD
jgi:hypothetical protein